MRFDSIVRIYVEVGLAKMVKKSVIAAASVHELSEYS